MFHKNLSKFAKIASITMTIMILTVGCSQTAKEETNKRLNEKETKVATDMSGKETEVLNEINKVEKETSTSVNETGTRVLTDMVGRKVEIPNKVNKVFTTSPVGTIALYTINPSKIAGLNTKAGDLESKYLSKEYLELPVLGTYKDSKSGNEEEILKAEPDIIISMGNLDESWVESADESQEKLGIPFLMIDGNIENLDKSYEFLGEVLREQERCKELAEYCRETIEDTKKLASKIQQDKRKRIYYATDSGALSSAVSGSLHTQAIELIGGINVVEAELEKTAKVFSRAEDELEVRSSRVTLSMEQVLKWNPEIIIATQTNDSYDEAYESIVKNTKWGSQWGTIDAVKNNQVYGIPYAPFNWFDRPPSVNRILGIRWLGNLVYPEYFKINVKKETKDFYKKFYHRELTDKEVEEILKDSIRKNS